MTPKPKIVYQNDIARDRQTAPDERMLLDLGDLWNSVKSRAWMIAVSVIFCIVLGFYIIVTTTPKFWASSEIMLDPSDLRLLAGETRVARQEVNESVIANEVEVLGSNLLLDDLISELSLDEVTEFSQPVPPSTARTAARALLRLVTGEPDPNEQVSLNRDEIVDRLQDSLVISPMGISHGIRIGVLSTDPNRAATIANTLPALYIAQRYDRSLSEVTHATGLLEERTATWRAEMAKLEAEVVARRSELLELEQSNRLLTEQILLDTSRELDALRRDKIALEARESSLGALIEAEGLERAAGVITTGEVARIRESLTDARILRDERAASLGPENAESKAAEVQLLAITRLLISSVESYMRSLADEIALVTSHESALAVQLRDATDASIALEKGSIELGQIELEAAAARRVYEDLLQRLHETRAAQAFGSAGARMIEQADIPSVHARPKKTMTMAASVGFGIFFGLAIIIAQQLFTPRVRSLREVAHLSRLPVVAAFPAVSVVQRLWGAVTGRVNAGTLGGRAERTREEMRKLRNAISADLSAGSSVLSCVLTSTACDAGRTTISVELARSFASNGAKILLVDGDLRHSALTHRFGLAENQGFSDALLRKVSVDKVIVTQDDRAFDVMPVGTLASVAIEKISEPKITAMLRSIEPQYDLVLFDASSWGEAAETSIFARAADGAVLVVDVSATPREVIQTVARGLERVGVNTIGAVANKTAFVVSRPTWEGEA